MRPWFDGRVSKALAHAERKTICDLFEALGPDHPTLCEGWSNFHMVAHLVVREWNPVASLGIVAAPLHGLHDGAIERAMHKRSYDDLVARIRKGAPPWWKPVEGLTNFGEYFVHVEDVRRGAGDHTPRPRDEIAAIEADLWSMLAKSAKLAVRKAKGIGVDLVDDLGDVHHVRPAPEGAGTATITGRPGEIQLYLMGRRDAAQVELSGPDDAIAVLSGADLGI